MLPCKTVTITVLLLSILIFVVSSETAMKLDGKGTRRYFNYYNPTYMVMVLTAISSAIVGAICFLDLCMEARREITERSKTK